MGLLGVHVTSVARDTHRRPATWQRMIVSRSPRMAATAGLLLGLGACTTTLSSIKTAKPAAVDTEGWNAMHLHAQADLACAVAQLSAKKLGETAVKDGQDDSFEIKGCGGTEILTIRSVARMGGMTTAWALYSDMDLRKKVRFSFAEKCPDTTIEFVDTKTRGVTACGHKIIYVLSPSGWVANTDSSEE